jgi:hypothetical protein
VLFAVSVALIVKLEVPAAFGVPLSAPVELFNVNPPGSVPPDTENVYEPVPPLAVMVCE